MKRAIVLDLETKKSFQEIKDRDPKKLGVSVVGIYSYKNDSFSSYLENELDKLFPILEHSSLIIGFNLDRFDMPVLQNYYVGNLLNLPTLDILEDVKNSLGKRIALNELAKETLKLKKSGHGLLAINYYREGKIDKLKKYCLDDVKITRDLFEYGKKSGKLFYQSPFGRKEIKVNWRDIENRIKVTKEDINLTLPI